MRKVKVICTIGPTCSSDDMIQKMILAGMDLARLNFSHGDHESHSRIFAKLRKAAKANHRPLAIIQDVQGPRIRLGEMENGQASLEAGQSFQLSCKPMKGNARRASVQYPELCKDVKKGDRILLRDGTIQLRVTEVEGKDIYTKVVVGGDITDHSGLNLPGITISAPTITDNDKQDIKLGIELGVDVVALSFVRSPEDVLEARRLLRRANSSALVIAKIEHPDAVVQLDEILDVCDGIMVARGDLGVELPPEKVPAIQKSAIGHANARGKVVIVATQMLESMVHNPRPTRAEASDVANAVFDGADALMLSGETASGKFPLEALQMMVRIAQEAEGSPAFRTALRPALLKDPAVVPNALSKAAVMAAADVGAQIIVAYTASDQTARLLSDYRPDARIIALTPREDTFNRLSAYWGVEPFKVPPCRTTDAMLEQANRLLVERALARPGDVVVICSGVPIGQIGSTNMVKLHRIH